MYKLDVNSQRKIYQKPDEIIQPELGKKHIQLTKNSFMVYMQVKAHKLCSKRTYYLLNKRHPDCSIINWKPEIV